jgi:hypothetical protein
MHKAVIINIGILLFMLATYFFLRNFVRTDQSYERLYAEIVRSDKYKVKGRND